MGKVEVDLKQCLSNRLINERDEPVGVAVYEEGRLVGTLSGIRDINVYSSWIDGQMSFRFQPRS